MIDVGTYPTICDRTDGASRKSKPQSDRLLVPQNLVGYDPNPKLLAEAAPSVSAGAELTTDIDSLIGKRPSSFSLIYCMEVCEHLTDKSLDELLKRITVLAAPGARIIFGVPI